MMYDYARHLAAAGHKIMVLAPESNRPVPGLSWQGFPAGMEMYYYRKTGDWRRSCYFDFSRRELREFFVEVFLAFVGRRVEHGEELCEAWAEVAAVPRSAVFEVEAEGFALEQPGVLGKQTKQDADEKAFEVVTGVTAGFKGVVKFTEHFGGVGVDGVLLLELVLLVAGDEGE